MSFRLSDAEYRHLAEIARNSGADSLSAFARFAVRSCNTFSGDGQLEREMAYLQGEVEELQRALESVMEMAKPRKRTGSSAVRRTGNGSTL